MWYLMPTSHSLWGSTFLSEDSSFEEELVLDVLAGVEDRWTNFNTPQQITSGAYALSVEERENYFQTSSSMTKNQEPRPRIKNQELPRPRRGSEGPSWRQTQFSPQDSRSMDISPYLRASGGRGRRREGPLGLQVFKEECLHLQLSLQG